MKMTTAQVVVTSEISKEYPHPDHTRQTNYIPHLGRLEYTRALNFAQKKICEACGIGSGEERIIRGEERVTRSHKNATKSGGKKTQLK